MAICQHGYTIMTFEKKAYVHYLLIDGINSTCDSKNQTTNRDCKKC